MPIPQPPAHENKKKSPYKTHTNRIRYRENTYICRKTITRNMPLKHWDDPTLTVAGTDEAGRGCLAGPVTAAAVILPTDYFHPLLNDSKRMTARNRDILRGIIEREAVAWAVAEIPAARIDEINILNASFEGMNTAITQLETPPQFIAVDGNRFRTHLTLPYACIVKGDGKYADIAAASVLAKTHRDEYMKSIAAQYPQYGWDKNMAYPTAAHREAIRKFGTTPYHRMSYTLLRDDPVLF